MSAITYPTFITWKINLEGIKSIEQLISEKQFQRIKKTRTIIKNSDYRFAVEPVNDTYLEKFLPLYESAIRVKKHAIVHDVRQKVNEGIASGKVYQSISLYKDQTFLGGMIYNIRKSSLAVAYRSFPHKLELKTPISCSYVGEYCLVKEALDLQKRHINHGKDRNPFGQGAAIGLAEYKLRLGATAYVSNDPEVTFETLEPTNAIEDTLVLLANIPKQKITSAILCLVNPSAETNTRYAGVLNQNNLKIDVREILS